MSCKGICDKYSVTEGTTVRDWNDDPKLRRCSTCDIIIHEKDWLTTKFGRKICPCCKLQLKANSRGKIARKKRSDQYWEKVGQITILSLSKTRYIKFLIKQYNKLNFKDFDLIELAEMSKGEWKNKRFTIPEGYRIKNHSHSNQFEKIPREELIKSKILGKKKQPKSN